MWISLSFFFFFNDTATTEIYTLSLHDALPITGTLDIIVVDPVQAAEQMRDLATHLSGFVVSSRVSGSDERTRSAQVTVRIPAKYFDEARTQVRRIAKTVEQDTVEARDATREYVDQEARLRNARAEETQYLAILKRAAAVKDVLEVSSRLAEVRGRIDESEADLPSSHGYISYALFCLKKKTTRHATPRRTL